MIIHRLVGNLAFGRPPLSNILFMGSPNVLIQGVLLRDDQNSTHGGEGPRQSNVCSASVQDQLEPSFRDGWTSALSTLSPGTFQR